MEQKHPINGRQADDAAKALARLQRFSKFLDAEFRVPGTQIRLGLDAILGLIPGIGDSASALMSLYVLFEAFRYDIPGSVRGKMIGNVVIDVLVGFVPVLGDVFDIFFKANLRNTELLSEHLRKQIPVEQGGSQVTEQPGINRKNLFWLLLVAVMILLFAMIGVVQVGGWILGGP